MAGPGRCALSVKRPADAGQFRQAVHMQLPRAAPRLAQMCCNLHASPNQLSTMSPKWAEEQAQEAGAAMQRSERCAPGRQQLMTGLHAAVLVYCAKMHHFHICARHTALHHLCRKFHTLIP